MIESAENEFVNFHREEGFLGMWKGLGPNVARNAIINAAELASFDQVSLVPN